MQNSDANDSEEEMRTQPLSFYLLMWIGTYESDRHGGLAELRLYIVFEDATWL